MTVPRSSRLPNVVRQFAQTLAPLTLLVVLLIFLHWRTEGKMLTAGNLHNVVVRNLPLALVAIGETLVIVSGHIDLGVGSVMALSAVTAAMLAKAGLAFPAAAAIAILIGIVSGLLNGVITTKVRMPSFITTLAMMGLARGLALVVSEARTISGGFNQTPGYIADPILGLAAGAWLLIIVAVVVHVLLGYSIFGRSIYALGANEPAARLSGIRTHRVLIWVFVLEGVLVGLAGLINMMNNASAEPNMATGIELDAIAAVVIGGASLSGGQGSIGGTLVGVAIMAVLINGCNLLGIDNPWSKVIIAPLIVLAVVYDRWLRSRSNQAA